MDENRQQNESPIQESNPAPQAPPAQSAPPYNQAAASQIDALQRTSKSGANWFYWIAGFSIVNSLIVLFGGGMSFVVGLGATQILDSAIANMGKAAALIALPISLFIAAIYVMFGYFANKKQHWAFITGMVFYSLDSALFLIVKDWFPFAFHLFALYCIFNGFKAQCQMEDIEKQMAGGFTRFQ